MRQINDDTANDEMFIAVNWLEFVEANKLLSIALHLKFGKGQLHVSSTNEIFKTCGPAVKTLSKNKSLVHNYR